MRRYSRAEYAWKITKANEAIRRAKARRAAWITRAREDGGMSLTELSTATGLSREGVRKAGRAQSEEEVADNG